MEPPDITNRADHEPVRKLDERVGVAGCLRCRTHARARWQRARGEAGAQAGPVEQRGQRQGHGRLIIGNAEDYPARAGGLRLDRGRTRRFLRRGEVVVGALGDVLGSQFEGQPRRQRGVDALQRRPVLRGTKVAQVHVEDEQVVRTDEAKMIRHVDSRRVESSDANGPLSARDLWVLTQVARKTPGPRPAICAAVE